MLFELGGKRKRLIQVIYAVLAVLMAVALVGFGIGGATSGGIFDAIGLGGDGSSSPQYDQQIDSANEALAQDPKDERALLKLARYEFLSGQDQLETDAATGQRTLTDEAVTSYQAAKDAWERYLKTDPKKPDDNVAALMLQAYQVTAGIDPSKLEADVKGGFESARIIAEAQPSFGAYTNLATWAYLAGKDDEAEAAKKKALAEAPDKTTRQQVSQQLKAAQQQRKAVEKALKQSAPDESQLQNPLEGLGGSASGLPGTAP